MNSLVVTIDGPSAAGKSTTAREVARRLGWLYLDSGALYRAFALRVARENIDPEDRDAVRALARATDIDLAPAAEGMRVLLDGRDVSGDLRSPAVTELSSKLAQQPAVRERLVELQRRIAERRSLVAEGRDMGTVVFPEATVKIYLDAAPDARAERRWRELSERGDGSTLAQVGADLARRDRRDRERPVAPLDVPEGSVIVDTTALSPEEQVRRVVSVIRSRHPEVEIERP